MEKAFCSTSIQNERIRPLQSSSVISHSYDVASATLAPRGRMRLLLTLPAALAFAGGFFRCFLKGPTRYFPQFELEMILKANLSLDRALLWGYYLMGLLDVFLLSLSWEKTIFGDVFF